MTTRRSFLAMLGAGAAITLTGCDARPARTTSALSTAPPDTVLLRTASGLATLRGGRLQGYGAAVLTPDAATIYAVRPAGPDTDLLTVATTSGEVRESVRLTGGWVPAVARSPAVALVEPAATAHGRTRTSVLIVGAQERPRRLDLAGNVEPDAFTADITGIFVLDWQPAAAPEHYRVREVSLDTGQLTALLTRDKQPVPPGEEVMRGVRRNAVFAPNRSVLYTLYTHQGAGWSDVEHASGEGWEPGFIHTLALDQHWAYCVDLPSPFGLDPGEGHSLAVSPDGAALYVVDAAGGRLAAVDTTQLAVTNHVGVPAGRGTAYTATTPDTLVVGVGPQLYAVDTGTLDVRARWTLPGAVTGLAASADHARLYLARAGVLEWRDPRTGVTLGAIPVPGLTGLLGVV